MAILIFLGIPVLVWVLIMLVSLPLVVSPREEKPGVWKLYPDGPPQFQLDYSGKLWIDRKHKGFFRSLRRPHLPPEEPTG